MSGDSCWYVMWPGNGKLHFPFHFEQYALSNALKSLTWTRFVKFSSFCRTDVFVCGRIRRCSYKWRKASYSLQMMLIETEQEWSVLMWKPLLFLGLLSLTLVNWMRVCEEPGRSQSSDPFTAIVIQPWELSDSQWLTAALRPKQFFFSFLFF